MADVLPKAHARGIDLGVTSNTDCVIRGDDKALLTLLANLLDNAIKYTPRGGSVSLSAFEKAGQAVIIVEDTGVGIPQEETSRIWERLYRVDKSRSQRGLGLGLSLVKAVVRAHQGGVEPQLWQTGAAVP